MKSKIRKRTELFCVIVGAVVPQYDGVKVTEVKLVSEKRT
jgi:hypothetical protein